MQKECTKCLELLDISFFYKDKYQSDGYGCICKKCKEVARKSYGTNPNLKKNPGLDLPSHLNYCLTCERVLPLHEFSKLTHSPKGVSNLCRDCKKVKRKAILYIEVDSKKCNTCGQIKTINEFGVNLYSKDGHQGKCKLCAKIARQEAYNKDIEKSREYNRTKELNSNRYKKWVRGTICSHRFRNIKIEIDRKELYEYAISKTHCEFCGVELLWNIIERKQGVQANSPTLENLHNSNLIISLEDIAIVCHRCNITKGEKPILEFLDFIKKIIPNLENLIDTKQITLLSSESRNEKLLDSDVNIQTSSLPPANESGYL